MAMHLSPWDYVIVCATLIVSIVFGLYNGCFKTKQSTFFEYFLGSRQISPFPIIISTFATITASGFFIGFPIEIYTNGLQPILTVFVFIILIPVINYFVAPTFIQLKSGNLFEFYEIRYNRTLKNVVTFVYIAISVTFSSIQIYGPATALSLVTGIHVWLIVSAITVLCLIYTIFGGMRAVVFADTIQGIQMIVALMILLTVGTISLGGLEIVWATNFGRNDTKIINFSMDPNLTHTFWSDSIGWTFTYISFLAMNQSFMQRIMACSTLKQAQRVNTMSMIVTIIGYSLLIYLGMLTYTTFNTCDPLMSGKIRNINQLVPYYIMHTFHYYPGLPGLYFAGILSASLSTLSSAVNSWAAISMESFISPLNPNMTETKQTNICKFLSLIFGVLSTAGVLLTQLFPNVLQAAVVIAAIVTCPLFALFTIGVCCPQANRKGCIVAFIFTIIFGIWLMAGGLLFSKNGPSKKFSTEGCFSEEIGNISLTFSTANITNSITTPSTYIRNATSRIVLDEELTSYNDYDSHVQSLLKVVFPFAKISYLWIGCIIYWMPIILCAILTCCLGKEECDEKFQKYIPPLVKFLHRLLPPKLRPYFLCDYGETLVNENIAEKSQLTALLPDV